MTFVQLDGAHVRRLRQRKHWNQEELARRADVDTRTISRLESSSSVRVYPGTAKRLADALGESIETFERRTQPARENGQPNGLLTGEENGRRKQFPAVDASWRVISNHKLLYLTQDVRRVRLRDFWLLAGGETAEPIVLTYLTTGAHIEGRCLSHPDAFRSEHRADVAKRLGRRPHMERAWQFTGTLLSPAEFSSREDRVALEMEIDFVDAFGPDQQMFQVRTPYPTKEFTLNLLFTEGRRFTRVWGTRVVGATLARESAAGDLLQARDGSYASWRVRRPVFDGIYELRWE